MMRIGGLSSRAIIGRFYEVLERMMDAGWGPRLSIPFRSNQESETYPHLGMTPPLREWGSGRLLKALNEHAITVVNKVFESSILYHVDDQRRDKTGQMMVRVAELADRAAELPEDLLSTLMLNGHGSTSGLCYDGHYFFDTLHAEGDSGVQSNLLTVTELPAALLVEDADPTKVTEAEMAAAILGVIAYMIGYKDDHGKPINGRGRQWMVMVPPSLYPTAVAACTSRNLQAAAGNVKDNTLLQAGAFEVTAVANPLLSAWTVDFCVFRMDGRVKPFIWQDELLPKMDVIGAGSELEINQRCHQYSVTRICNGAYGLWQYAAKATLST